ncbi:calcium/sodium antiporter [Alkaliphilus pronyensis]|uniref:Calcium/sodium antiporter n=1 Tax=Alkaliphilus pronyensis TaxID=1482732 RepID=A0A6I0FAI1_9FIRM|nr:calcium/sodium antiporter [Alkaliphilus pronyensis]KAB3535783.1 calcium/sodium antiporter [Alkaliphilus pronyensis]
MENFNIILLFILGVVIIIKGGDWFVESAVWVAKVTGIPNVIIGATIISIATTLPEQLVSIIATYQGHYDVAIGNALGSVICNIGLILSVSLIFSPSQVVNRDYSIKSIYMLISAVILFLFSIDLVVSKLEGIILLVLCVVYFIVNIIEIRKGNKAVNQQLDDLKASKKLLKHNLVRFILGTAFIVLGARLLVNNGVKLATMLGASQQVISLTLVALGTSLPELVTAVSSIIKKEYGIAVGNIIGANILNMLLVVGVSTQFSSVGLEISNQLAKIGGNINYYIPQTLYYDLPVAILMIATLTVFGTIFKKLNKVIGGILLTTYVLYLAGLLNVFI